MKIEKPFQLSLCTLNVNIYVFAETVCVLLDTAHMPLQGISGRAILLSFNTPRASVCVFVYIYTN